MRALLVTSAVICVAIGVGVGVVDATSSSPSSAAVAVATAVADTLGAGSARVTMEFGAAPGPQVTTSIASGRGLVDFADGSSRLALEVGGATATGAVLDEIDVGGNLYLHIPQLSSRFPRLDWIEVPARASNAAEQGRSGVSSSMTLLRALERPGNSVTSTRTLTVNGEELHEYSVTVHPAPMRDAFDNALIPGAVRRAIRSAVADRPPLVFSIWVGPADRVVRVAGGTTMSVPGSATATVKFVLDLGDFGVSSAIAPPVSGVVSLRELLQLDKVFAKL